VAASTSHKRASNHIPAPDRYLRVDPSTPWVHRISRLQNGARETGLGHWLPGFLRSNVEINLPLFQFPIMPQLTPK